MLSIPQKRPAKYPLEDNRETKRIKELHSLARNELIAEATRLGIPQPTGHKGRKQTWVNAIISWSEHSTSDLKRSKLQMKVPSPLTSSSVSPIKPDRPVLSGPETPTKAIQQHAKHVAFAQTPETTLRSPNTCKSAWAFGVVDVDANKSISQEELQNTDRAFGVKTPLQEFDLDGNGEIDEKEFAALRDTPLRLRLDALHEVDRACPNKAKSIGLIEFKKRRCVCGDAQFLRIPSQMNDEAIDAVYKLLKTGWLTEKDSLGKPSLLISVTGDAVAVELSPHDKKALNTNLAIAVASTNSWITDGGTEAGVMKIIGDMKAATQINTKVIGFATWDKVFQKQTLMPPGTAGDGGDDDDDATAVDDDGHDSVGLRAVSREDTLETSCQVTACHMERETTMKLSETAKPNAIHVSKMGRTIPFKAVYNNPLEMLASAREEDQAALGKQFHLQILQVLKVRPHDQCFCQLPLDPLSICRSNL